MAAPASTEDQWRRRWRRDDGDLDDDNEPQVVDEEGETVPGYHSETDTDEYYNRHSPSEYDDEAVSSHRATTSVDVPATANNGSNAASPSSVVRGWGGTGKRGHSGLGSLGRAVSPIAEPDHQSIAGVATAAPNPVLQPVPLAFAPSRILPSSSVAMAIATRTNLSGESSNAQSVHDDAVDTELVAGAASASPSAETIVVHQQPVAPPPRRPAPAVGRQNPDGYTCPKCGMWFATHQGLGGHSVGHNLRERDLLADVAVPGRRDDAKLERVHVCGDCGAEFAKGVQLGGHKRKHWAGAPIVPKKKPRAAVAVLDQHLAPPVGSAERAADITLALAVKADKTGAVPAAETTLQPAARSPVAGRVRLFSVDIVPVVQKPEVRQGSPASTSTVVQQ